MPISGAVGQNQFQTHALVRGLARGVGRKPPIPIEVLPLADGEINLDGVDSGHRGYRPAVRIDQGAHLKLGLSSNAINGRNEPGKIEVDLGRFHSSLSGLDLRFSCGHRCLRRHVVLNGVVQILLAGGLLLRQRNVAVHVKLGPALHCLSIGKNGLGLRQLPLGLIERRLKGTRVDLEEQLPLLDECAFLVALPLQVARDLCPDVGIGESVERANPLAKNRNVPLLNLHDLNVRRSTWLRSRYVLRAQRSNNQADDDQAKRSPYHEFVFRKNVHLLPSPACPHAEIDMLGFRALHCVGARLVRALKLMVKPCGPARYGTSLRRKSQAGRKSPARGVPPIFDSTPLRKGTSKMNSLYLSCFYAQSPGVPLTQHPRRGIAWTFERPLLFQPVWVCRQVDSPGVL